MTGDRLVLCVFLVATACSRDARLCTEDPSSELRFRVDSIGMIGSETELLVESGHALLVVSPSCDFFVKTTSFGDVTQGRFTEEQAAELAAKLRLADWPGGEARYQTNLCDGPVETYRFDASRLVVGSLCHGVNTAEGVAWLRSSVRSELAPVAALGTRLRSPIKYVVVRNEQGIDASLPEYRNPQRWPLTSRLSELALPPGSSTAGAGRLADGADADELDALQTLYRDGVTGDPWSHFVPVEDPTGMYRLYLRSVLPFEDADGTWKAF